MCEAADASPFHLTRAAWQYLCTLPKPPPLHSVGGAEGLADRGGGGAAAAAWPDVTAVGLTSDGQRAACLYGDRGLFVWDLRDPSRVCRCPRHPRQRICSVGMLACRLACRSGVASLFGWHARSAGRSFPTYLVFRLLLCILHPLPF